MADPWSSGEAYDAFVGRWSRSLAPKFLEWAGVGGRGVRALDIGCGTGSLSRALLASGASSVTGIDASSAYVEAARRSFAGEAAATFEVGDATELPYGDESFDAAVSGLVINFVPDPLAMVLEMRRVLRTGGRAAVFVWDYAGKMEPLRRFWDAAVALDPPAATFDEGRRFPLCQPEALEALFEGAGFEAVKTGHIDEPTVFRDFADYWSPFEGGQGPAPAYLASLPGARQEELRRHLEAALPAGPEGTIGMVARAWTVCGVRGGDSRRGADRGD